MNTKIAYVPLDSRPCNSIFPIKIGSIAGVEVLTPPLPLLGYFNKQGECEKIRGWLRNVADKVDSIIISVEMLSYGGLIPSRNPGTKLNDAMKRLDIFRDLRRINPKARISAFSLIMRLSVTAGIGAGEELWKKIFMYSELFDKVEEHGLQNDKEQLSRLEKEIPQDVLINFLGSRARNHEVNKKMLQLISEGNLDFLVIGEDDVAKYGLHRKERESLGRAVSELSIGNKVKMMCGADEVGMMLVAKNAIKSSPKIFVHPSDPGGLEIVPLYEDRPLSRSIDEHISVIGALRVNREEEADVILFVNAPKGAQRDLFLEGPGGERGDLKGFVGKIREATMSGKMVAIADVHYANGADPLFMELLQTEVLLKKLASFAAWNTASNSLGSALAQAAAFLAGEENGEPSHAKASAGRQKTEDRNKTFLLERFIDDHLYQTVLRQKIKKDLLEKGISIYDLKDEYAGVNWVVKQELKALAIEFAKKHFKDIKVSDMQIDLPWPRIFEINAELRS